MSKFTQPLILSPYLNWLKDRARAVSRNDEKAWVLLNDNLTYEIGELGSGNIIQIPTGFVTDLASVPRIVWWLIPPFGSHAQAAVLHDFLYQERTGTRREADKIFHEAMRVLDTPRLRAWVMWLAVRSPAGWWAWFSGRNNPGAHVVEFNLTY